MMNKSQTIAVVGSKGGIGKSQIVRAWAVQGLIEGYRASIVDCDPQKTCMKWADRRNKAGTAEFKVRPPACVEVGASTIPARIKELQERGAELVVLDTPPHAFATINVAIEEATAVIIVSGPYKDDTQEVVNTATIVKHLGKPACVLLNKLREGFVVNQRARDELTEDIGLPVCSVGITDLTAFSYGSDLGLAGQEMDRGKPAAQLAEAWAWFDSHILNPEIELVEAKRRAAR